VLGEKAGADEGLAPRERLNDKGMPRMDHKGLAGMTSAKWKGGWGRAFLLLALGSPILLSQPALGQAAGAASPEQQARRRYTRLGIDDQVKGLARNLDLNDAQQSAVKKILEQRRQATLRIGRESSGSDRISRFRALQVRTAAQIRAVLNDEQKKKYNPLGQRPPQQTSPQPSVEDWIKATTAH
jgi:hypothetical protein